MATLTQSIGVGIGVGIAGSSIIYASCQGLIHAIVIIFIIILFILLVNVALNDDKPKCACEILPRVLLISSIAVSAVIYSWLVIINKML